MCRLCLCIYLEENGKKAYILETVYCTFTTDVHVHIQYEHTFCTKHLEAQCCLPDTALKGRVQSVLKAAVCNPPPRGGQGCTIPVKEQYGLLRHVNTLTIMNKYRLRKHIHTARNQLKRSRPVAHSFVLQVCTSVLQKTSFSARQSAPHTTDHPS